MAFFEFSEFGINHDLAIGFTAVPFIVSKMIGFSFIKEGEGCELGDDGLGIDLFLLQFADHV